MLDRAAEFRHRLQISRQLLPARQRRAKLPRKIHPKSIALSYYRAIMPILARARQALERAITPLLPELAARAAEAQRHDAADINAIIDAVGKEFFDSLKPAEIAALADRFARATSDYEREQAVKQVRAAFGVDVIAREPQLAAKQAAFVSENVALIKSIPSQFFDDVEKRIARAIATGATPKQLAAEIADRYKVADDRAMLIARDQIGKFFGQVAEARQKTMGVTHYTWRTSNDERVREEHAAREGEVFAWDDPPEGGNPGEDFQCRCFAEPLLDQLLVGDEPHAEEIASREQQTPPESEGVVTPPSESAPAQAEATPEEWTAFEAESSAKLGVSIGEADLRAALTPPRASGLGLRVETVETEPRLSVTGAITRDGEQVGVITRAFGRDPDGTLWVKHVDFGLDPKEQGHGVGEAIVRKSIEEYRRLGFDEVRLTATDAGRYVWAKQGFQWDDETAQRFESALPAFLESRGVHLTPERVGELARDPVGLASLQHEGVAVGKAFLLSPLVPRWNGTLSLK